jgi:amino acid permease
MTKYSVGGIGMYAVLVVSLLQFIGIDADEGQITEALLALATLVSFATWVWGQLSRKDLDWGIFRR